MWEEGNPWGVILDGPSCPNCEAGFDLQLLTMKEFGQRICKQCGHVYNPKQDWRQNFLYKSLVSTVILVARLRPILAKIDKN